MEQPSDRVTVSQDEYKNGRTAAVLDSYADHVERVGLVDSDFPHVLRRAARLLREHCPQVQEYDRQIKELRRTL